MPRKCSKELRKLESKRNIAVDKILAVGLQKDLLARYQERIEQIEYKQATMRHRKIDADGPAKFPQDLPRKVRQAYDHYERAKKLAEH